MIKPLLTAFMLCTALLSFSQKKKDLINEIEVLKLQIEKAETKLKAIEKAKEIDLENEDQRFSYAFGVAIGNNLKTGGFDETLSYNAIATAIEEVMQGNERIPLEACLDYVQNAFQQKQEEEAEKKAEEGAAFLAANGKREGIVTTASGLQYEIITKGEGAIPNANDKISVHYTGMLIDGKVFDSSVERGKPQTLKANEVIKGWQEALQQMPVGSKWKIYVPYDLGYGERGAGGGVIPPYAALIFEMELLGIEK